MDPTRKKVALRKAAKAVGKRYSFVRDLVDRGECRAWLEGGTVKKCITVYVDELRATIERVTRYVPPKKPKERKPAFLKPVPLSPMVRC